MKYWPLRSPPDPQKSVCKSLGCFAIFIENGPKLSNRIGIYQLNRPKNGLVGGTLHFLFRALFHENGRGFGNAPANILEQIDHNILLSKKCSREYLGEIFCSRRNLREKQDKSARARKSSLDHPPPHNLVRFDNNITCGQKFSPWITPGPIIEGNFTNNCPKYQLCSPDLRKFYYKYWAVGLQFDRI